MTFQNKNKYTFLNILLSTILIIILSGCFNITKHIKKLTPKEREFYFNVQPIMTKSERDIYFTLSSKDRVEFENNFWKIRDNSEHTDENEFKIKYLERVAVAKKAFWTDGQGLLSDRSRVYLVLGPPDESRDYPVIQSSKYRAAQKWVYLRKGLVAFFADINGVGKYELYNPDPQLLVFLEDAQDSIFGLNKDKKFIGIKYKKEKSNLIIRINTSTIEYKKDSKDVSYSITIRIKTIEKTVSTKTFKGVLNKNEKENLPNYLEFKVPINNIGKYSYFYLMVYDNIGENIGGKILKWKKSK